MRSKLSFNPRIMNLKSSPTLEINEQSLKLQQKGKKVFKFGFGQSPFPVPNVMVEELKNKANEKDYLPVQGLFTLRERISQFYQNRFNPDNIIIGPGSKELMFLLQLVLDCDLYLPQASWVSYSPQSEILGKKTIWIDSEVKDDYKLTPEKFEKEIKNGSKKSLVILNYPCNPTGATYSVEELKELTKVFRKYETIVLSDEIYGELHHEGMHNSISEFYPEGTIVSSGISKWLGSGGWRLGFLMIPDGLSEIMERLIPVASETFSCVSAPIQYAAIKGFENDTEIKEYKQNCCKILNQLGKYVHQKLSTVNVETPEPNGGFYLFPDFTKVLRDRFKTSEDMCMDSLEKIGFAMLPGSSFGFEKEILSSRISYVDFDGKLVLEKAKIEEVNDKFIEKYCPNVIEGTEKLINWVKSQK
eukprot:gene12609-6514_t